MKRKLLLILFVIVHFIKLEAQNISGLVKDIDSDLPIAGAKVSIENSGISTYTNQKGEFSLQTNARDELIITKTGYLEKKNQFTSKTNIVIELQRATIRIREVTLTDSKKL